MPQIQPARLAFAILALAWFAVAAEAQEARPGIVGEDDRQMIGNSAPPWSAIGHVNIGGHRMRWSCSGTLVAPRVVLTAAHCVINPWKRKIHPLRDIHFVAGVNKDNSLGSADAKCVKLLKDNAGKDYAAFMTEKSWKIESPEEAARDLAVIVLDKHLAKAGSIEIAIHQAKAWDGVLAHSSYPRSRRYVLTGQENCRVILDGGHLKVTDCDVEPGSSGGPILAKENGHYRIVGVAVAHREDGLGTVAVPITNWPDLPLMAECP